VVEDDIQRNFVLEFPSHDDVLTYAEENTCPANFYRNLKIDDSGADVKALQVFLNKEGFILAEEGPGAVGEETDYFGSLTKNALGRYQESKNISGNLGEFDKLTREYLGCVSEAVSPILAAVDSSIKGYIFSRDLSLGMEGKDVLQLQKILNAKGIVLASEGPGSPGNETEFFGNLTKDALMRYQAKEGIVPASGSFGAWTRWWMNKQ
jgi:peptidoglycan hydrolase-like protein with peptidoglycan-binding domain